MATPLHRAQKVPHRIVCGDFSRAYYAYLCSTWICAGTMSLILFLTTRCFLLPAPLSVRERNTSHTSGVRQPQTHINSSALPTLTSCHLCLTLSDKHNMSYSMLISDRQWAKQWQYKLLLLCVSCVRVMCALSGLRRRIFTLTPVVDTPPLHHCRPIGHHRWNPTALRGRLQLCLLFAIDLRRAEQAV